MLTVVFFYTGRRVTFNDNLMDMNYMTEKLKKAEAKISQKTNFTSSSVFMVTTGKDLDDALTNNEKISDNLTQLKNTGIIKEYFNVNDLMPSKKQQIEKIKLWNSFWELRKEPLFITMTAEAETIGFKPESFNRFFEMVDKEYSPLSSESFHEISRLFLQDYLIENADQSAVITLVKTEKENKMHLLYRNLHLFQKIRKVVLQLI